MWWFSLSSVFDGCALPVGGFAPCVSWSFLGLANAGSQYVSDDNVSETPGPGCPSAWFLEWRLSWGDRSGTSTNCSATSSRKMLGTSITCSTRGKPCIEETEDVPPAVLLSAAQERQADGTTNELSTICSTVRRCTRSSGLTSRSRSGRIPPSSSTVGSCNLTLPGTGDSRPKVLNRTSKISQGRQPRASPAEHRRVPPKTNISRTESQPMNGAMTSTFFRIIPSRRSTLPTSEGRQARYIRRIRNQIHTKQACRVTTLWTIQQAEYSPNHWPKVVHENQ